MRAVLDTNVVISALLWGGKPFSLLEAAVAARAGLVVSGDRHPPTLAAFGTVRIVTPDRAVHLIGRATA